MSGRALAALQSIAEALEARARQHECAGIHCSNCNPMELVELARNAQAVPEAQTDPRRWEADVMFAYLEYRERNGGGALRFAAELLVTKDAAILEMLKFVERIFANKRHDTPDSCDCFGCDAKKLLEVVPAALGEPRKAARP